MVPYCEWYGDLYVGRTVSYTIPLPNNTSRRRTESIALNVNENITAQVNNSEFLVIQLDESRNVRNNAEFMIYVLYVYQTRMKEEC